LVGDVGHSGLDVERVVHHLVNESPHGSIFLRQLAFVLSPRLTLDSKAGSPW
jgi:hypothetical protein